MYDFLVVFFSRVARFTVRSSRTISLFDAFLGMTLAEFFKGANVHRICNTRWLDGWFSTPKFPTYLEGAGPPEKLDTNNPHPLGLSTKFWKRV